MQLIELFAEPLEPVNEVDFKILEEAQNRKMDRKFQKTPCDWTGITISHEQLEWAKRLAAEADLEDKICFKYQDYRAYTLLILSRLRLVITHSCQLIFSPTVKLSASIDKIISVEMIEAVGQLFLPQYFQVLSDRLLPGGIAVLQGIICPDAYYDRYCRSSDFIKKYIFPGGHMPSIGTILPSIN
ncbi:Cyclopropane-fatty-acyl-phospholipid synthase [Cooperia oncophora]